MLFTVNMQTNFGFIDLIRSKKFVSLHGIVFFIYQKCSLIYLLMTIGSSIKCCVCVISIDVVNNNSSYQGWKVPNCMQHVMIA